MNPCCKRVLWVLVLLFGWTINAYASAHACANYPGSKSPVAVMPCPQELVFLPGDFVFTTDFDVTIETPDNTYYPQMNRLISEWFMPRLSQLTRLSFATAINANQQQAKLLIKLAQGQPSQNGLTRPPQLGDDESYHLDINSQQIQLTAITESGLRYGLETLIQLLYSSNELLAVRRGQASRISNLIIKDWPRFPWRGLLIDSVRHFLPVATIKRQLDGMASAKLNVMHWHLTDDQGWRFESLAYPKLHLLASDGQYYRRNEIKDIVNYAAQRGIRVVPEFDLPGHASAIAVAYPELMTVEKDYQPQRHWGVFEPLLDPSKPEVYRFIESIVSELSSLFPDLYLHIGGDEVKPTQWQQSEAVQAYMQQHALGKSGNGVLDLQAHFNQRASQILKKYQRKMMGWDEVFHPGLPKDTLVQSWRGLDSLAQITMAGYQGILSTGFYIDQAQYSSYHYRNDPLRQDAFIQPVANKETNRQDWVFTMPRLKGSAITGRLILVKNARQGDLAYLAFHGRSLRMVNDLKIKGDKVSFWSDTWMGPMRVKWDLANPIALSGQIFIGNTPYPVDGKKQGSSKGRHMSHARLQQGEALSDAAGERILGGEATLWGEMLTEDNIDVRAWPRLFAIAERLWSSAELTDEDNMYLRLRTLDRYASQVVGLQQRFQQATGLSALTDEYADISPLWHFSQILEPAHYYTRHHLKFQQGAYHQQAPLDRFVDFLPVESLPLLELKRQVKAFEQGDKSALAMLSARLLSWQDNMVKTDKMITQYPKLAELKPVINDAGKVLALGLEVIELCARAADKKALNKLTAQLADTRTAQGEIIIALVYVIEDLLAVC